MGEWVKKNRYAPFFKLTPGNLHMAFSSRKYFSYPQFSFLGYPLMGVCEMMYLSRKWVTVIIHFELFNSDLQTQSKNADEKNVLFVFDHN